MEVLLAALLVTDAEISREDDDDDDGPGPVENNHGAISLCEAHGRG